MNEKLISPKDILQEARDKYNSFAVAACSFGAVAKPERVFLHSPARVLDERSLFDLASLSKIIYSTALLRAMSQDNISFDRKIVEFLSDFPNENLTLQDLLSYRIYADDPKRFTILKSMLFHPYSAFSANHLYSLLEKMNAVKVEGKYSKYSNYPSWITRLVLGKIASGSPEAYVIDNIFLPAKMFNARFVPVFSKAAVPGERYRRKIKLTDWLSVDFKFKKGYPSDETAQAALLRAKAQLGHTGIFAGLQDLENFARFLHRAFLPQNPYKIFSDEIHKTAWNFYHNAESDKTGKDMFFAGFRYKGSKDRMLSDRFSRYSLLHAGFTGTFFALDILHGRQFILLSNRTFPSRDLSKLVHGTDNSSERINKIRKALSRFAF